MALNELNVVIGAKIQGFERQIKSIERQLSRFSRNIQRIGEDLTTSLSLPLAGIGTASIGAFAEIEKLEKALGAVMDLEPDAIALRKEIEKLRKVAEAPGLGFEQVVKASARLQAVGLSADQARETITQFGNAVARSGGGREEFDGVIFALGQIASKGRVYAEEINQINERIFEIRPALEAAFGTSNTEDLARLGVSSEEFIAKITQEFSKLERVNGGLANSFENFRDNAQQAFAIIGKEIARVFDLQGIVERLSSSLQKAAEFFAGLDDNVKRNIIQIGLFVAAVGPALLILGKLTSVFSLALVGARNLLGGIKILTGGIALLLSPIGLVIAGITSFAAAIIYAYRQSERFRQVLNGIIEVSLELVKIAKESLQAVSRGFGELGRGEFRKAASSFGEAIVKGNPIGIALTQGSRLGAAFADGFTDESDRIETGIQKIKEIFKSTQQSVLGGAVAPALPEGGTNFATDFERSSGKLEGVPKILKDIQTELKAVDSQAKLSGASFDDLTPKLEILSDGLQKLFQAGLQPASPAIQAIKGQIDALRGSVETLDQIATTTTQNISGNLIAAFTGVGFKPVIEQVQSLNTESQLLGGSLAKLGANVQLFQVPLTATFEKAAAIRQRFEELATTVTSTLNNAFISFAEVGIGGLFAAFAGAESFGNVFSSLFGLVADVLNNLGKAAIAAGIGVEAIRKALASLTGVGAIIAGGALIALSKIIKARVAKSAPGLAEGGIVPPGFPNDTFPARLTSGEAVIPLDRLEQMMNSNAGAIRLFGQFEVRGSDLILTLDRAKQEQFRIR